jgi:hypothetical protein
VPGVPATGAEVTALLQSVLRQHLPAAATCWLSTTAQHAAGTLAP